MLKKKLYYYWFFSLKKLNFFSLQWKKKLTCHSLHYTIIVPVFTIGTELVIKCCIIYGKLDFFSIAKNKNWDL